MSRRNAGMRTCVCVCVCVCVRARAYEHANTETVCARVCIICIRVYAFSETKSSACIQPVYVCAYSLSMHTCIVCIRVHALSFFLRIMRRFRCTHTRTRTRICTRIHTHAQHTHTHNTYTHTHFTAAHRHTPPRTDTLAGFRPCASGVVRRRCYWGLGCRV